MVNAFLFVGLDRFADVEELLAYLHIPVSGPNTDSVWPSAFGREVGMDTGSYDAGAISFALSDEVTSVRELLAYNPEAAEWASGGREAKVAVLVYPWVLLSHPERCSLEYVGTVACNELDTESSDVADDGA